jgi:hypothetical protein
MPEESVRIEIGFDGGQAMTLVVRAKQADELEQKLTEGTESAYGLEADDGRYVVALKRVVYVKRFMRESRVGFSG